MQTACPIPERTSPRWRTASARFTARGTRPSSAASSRNGTALSWSTSSGAPSATATSPTSGPECLAAGSRQTTVSPTSAPYRAVAGCVGEEAVLEFQTWEQSLDLPDPEGWLSDAINHRATHPNGDMTAMALDIPPRCDQVMAALAALVDRVKNHNLGPNGKPTEGRWLAAVDCFAEVAKCWLEPAIAAAGPLYFAVPHAAVLAKTPTNVSNTVLQIHKNIMAAS